MARKGMGIVRITQALGMRLFLCVILLFFAPAAQCNEARFAEPFPLEAQPMLFRVQQGSVPLSDGYAVQPSKPAVSAYAQVVPPAHSALAAFYLLLFSFGARAGYVVSRFHSPSLLCTLYVNHPKMAPPAPV